MKTLALIILSSPASSAASFAPLVIFSGDGQPSERSLHSLALSKALTARVFFAEEQGPRFGDLSYQGFVTTVGSTHGWAIVSWLRMVQAGSRRGPVLGDFA